MNSLLPSTGGLNRQIAFAFTGIVLLVTAVLGSAYLMALGAAEDHVLDEGLRAEVAHYRSEVEASRSLGAINSRTTVIHVAPLDDVGNIPQYLRSLPEGVHELEHQGRNFRVLVETIDGIRYTVQFDDTDTRARQREFLRSVFWSSLAVLVAALLTGLWLAKRLTAPVTRLSRDINRLRAESAAAVDLSFYKNDEIGKLAAELQQYHEQLQQTLLREKEFAGNVSHELRTPLTNISLAAEVMAAGPNLDARSKDRLQRIRRATKEMSELVDTFLVLSQVDSGSESFVNRCELRPIVDEVVEQQRVWLGDKPVDASIDEREAVLVAAPVRIVSVLVANLVRNAFRYTQSGSIRITLANNELSVEDTGAGIDPATHSRLFDRHVRGAPPATMVRAWDLLS